MAVARTTAYETNKTLSVVRADGFSAVPLSILKSNRQAPQASPVSQKKLGGCPESLGSEKAAV